MPQIYQYRTPRNSRHMSETDLDSFIMGQLNHEVPLKINHPELTSNCSMVLKYSIHNAMFKHNH